MTDVAALIADLIAAGTPPDLVGRVAAAIAGSAPPSEKNARQERNRRYYLNRLNRLNGHAKPSENVLSDANQDAPPSLPPAPSPDKEIPPTPPKENNPSPLPPSQPGEGTRKRGTRLPTDWVLPRDWGNWALKEFPALSVEDVRRLADDFRDYWIGVPGAKGTKLDWQATWRNSVRMKAPRATARASPPRNESVISRRTRELRERIARDGIGGERTGTDENAGGLFRLADYRRDD